MTGFIRGGPRDGSGGVDAFKGVAGNAVGANDGRQEEMGSHCPVHARAELQM